MIITKQKGSKDVSSQMTSYNPYTNLASIYIYICTRHTIDMRWWHNTRPPIVILTKNHVKSNQISNDDGEIYGKFKSLTPFWHVRHTNRRPNTCIQISVQATSTGTCVKKKRREISYERYKQLDFGLRVIAKSKNKTVVSKRTRIFFFLHQRDAFWNKLGPYRQ